jgi:hypothetical protein
VVSLTQQRANSTARRAGMEHPGLCKTIHIETIRKRKKGVNFLNYTECCRKTAETVQHYIISYLSI